ncbi:MAG TPA: hypothetical protein VID95_02475 [Candidatus Limnocylindrales bacterium]
MTDLLESMDPFELALRRRMLAASELVLRPFDPLAITDAAVGPARVGLSRRSSRVSMRRWLLVAAVVTVVAATLFGLAIAARPQLPVTPTPRPSVLAVATFEPSSGPPASPSSSQSPAPTPSVTSGPAEGPVPLLVGPTPDGTAEITRGFGMLFTFVPPRTSEAIAYSIADRNDITIEWRRPGAFRSFPEIAARLQFLDHAGMTTDVCEPADVGHVAWPVTPEETTRWAKTLFGPRAVRRPPVMVDGRSVVVFDIKAGPCDLYHQKDDPATRLRRLYIIPTDADTIIAYAAIFRGGATLTLADRLIKSIHFVR